MTVTQYHDMIRHGILTDGDHVELLEGWLVEKMPKNPPHRLSNRLLRGWLEKMMPAGWHVQTQEPITLGDSEPDLALVRGQPEDYGRRHPGPADLLLVVEASDTTLTRDRGPKKRAYARANIPFYWIVNLVEETVEMYSQPGLRGNEPDYLQRVGVPLEGTVTLEVDGQELKVPVKEFLRRSE